MKRVYPNYTLTLILLWQLTIQSNILEINSVPTINKDFRFPNINPQDSRDCILFDSNLLDMQRFYFKEARTIHIKVLCDKNVEKEENMNNNDFYKMVFQLNSAIYIQRIFHYREENVTKTKIRRAVTEDKQTHHILADSETIISRIRRYSGNPLESFIILSWDEKILLKILQIDSEIIIPNPRASYIIFFMQNKLPNCKNRTINYKARFQQIAKQFWTDFGVLNILIIAPCYCSARSVYMYEPFDGIDNETNAVGECEEIKLEDIITEPENILNILTNLRGYKMKISIFERPPTAVRNLTYIVTENSLYKDINRSEGFGGVDGLVLLNLAKALNFTIDIVGPSEGEDYGRLLKDGTATGSLKDVITGMADFSANSRFMSAIETGVEYTRPINTDRICILVPKSDKIPQWLMLFHCFKPQSWISILCLVTLSTLFWIFIHFISFDLKQTELFSLNRRVNWSILRLFLFSQMVSLPKASYSRIFLASILAFNVIINGIFQGSLVTSFSTVSYYEDINTLAELEASKFKIFTTLNIFENDTTSEVRMKLNKKTFLSSERSMDRASYKRDIAAIERKKDAYFLINTKYLHNDGMPYLHIVQECPSSTFLAYIVPVGSPFLPRFNSILIRFMEGGFIDKWYNDLVETLVLRKMASLRDDSLNKKFSLGDIQTAFYFLGFGILFATIVLLIEIYANRKGSKKNIPRIMLEKHGNMHLLIVKVWYKSEKMTQRLK